MGRISENAIDFSESLHICELGISVRGQSSVVHKDADFLCVPSCISCPNDLEIKSKRIAKPVMNLDDQCLGSDHVQTVQAVQKQQGGNNVWRSGGSFFPKSKSIISPFDSLLKVFMIFVIFMDVRGDLIEIPENNAIRANEMAIMKCRTNSTTKPIIWTATDRKNGLLSIYDGEKVNPTYEGIVSVNPSDRRYDLLVKATSQMALAYKCIEPGAENIERTAELIVIESDPTCFVTPNVPSNAGNTEFIDLVCNMSLSGNWIPSLIWRVNGIQEPLTASKSDPPRFDSQRVIVTSTLSNVSRNDKYKYLCEASFSLESHTGVTARNVPDYKYTCTARDLPPTLSTTTLSPVTTTTSFPPNPPSPPPASGFNTILALFVIENVALLIGIIAYLYKNNWKLPCFESKTRTDEGSPPMLKDVDNSKPAPTIYGKPSAVSSGENDV